jgi:hypothetical protein
LKLDIFENFEETFTEVEKSVYVELAVERLAGKLKTYSGQRKFVELYNYGRSGDARASEILPFIFAENLDTLAKLCNDSTEEIVKCAQSVIDRVADRLEPADKAVEETTAAETPVPPLLSAFGKIRQAVQALFKGKVN